MTAPEAPECPACGKRRCPVTHSCTGIRPAASGGATDGEREHEVIVEIREGDHVGIKCIPCREVIEVRPIRAAVSLSEVHWLARNHPVRPAASQADGELRERVEALVEKWRGWQENSRRYGAAHPEQADVALARELAYGRAIEDLRRALDGGR